ncbi:FtsW/RodA/SpoVE family cell cycle protein [Planosporangium sp. 12N6]|uniref:FtsW/RodA/SpoVE family cell cycle protein n=1 Tax=Planosporangium spinosum TaxID=3402278 RepID=UPI003CED4878
MKTDTTVEDRKVPATAGPASAPAAGRLVAGRLAVLRGLLDRPLASYYLLLASVGLLLIFGLVMVFSATSVENYKESGSAYTSVSKQALWAVVGLVAFWVCQRLPMRTYRAVSRVAVIGCLVLVALTDVLAFLTALNTPPGSEWVPVYVGPLYAEDLWLYIGGFQLQPSEMSKLGLVLWSADVLARKGTKIVNWRELITPLFPVALLLFGLVGYGDFGSMTCLFVLFLGVLWAAGVRKRIFALLFGGAAVGMTVLITTASYRAERLTVFLDPEHADRTRGAYQFFQGLYAIANGGWFGVGLGKSELKWGWLPNGHNDSIFAVVGEELGVVGCVVLLALFGVLAYTGLRIASRVEHPFRRLVAAGITCWLVGQSVINIGGVIGVMPMTGVPLPFISAGGTALVVALAAAGILTSFARAEPDAARALHARPPRRWVQLVWAPLPPLPRGGNRRRAGSTGARGQSAGSPGSRGQSAGSTGARGQGAGSPGSRGQSAGSPGSRGQRAGASGRAGARADVGGRANGSGRNR